LDLSAPGHFKAGTIAYAAGQGVPLASIAVPLSGIVEFLGALSIVLGYKAKLGAWLIVLFLVPVTLSLHRFWGDCGSARGDDPAGDVPQEPGAARHRAADRAGGLGAAQPQELRVLERWAGVPSSVARFG